MVVGALLNRVFEVALTSTIVSDLFMPRDYSRGGGGIKIFPQFSMGLLKPCIFLWI